MSAARLIEALTDQQKSIISRDLHGDYPLERSIDDVDLIYELTVLKIKIRKGELYGV